MQKYFQAPWKPREILLIIAATVLMLILYLLLMSYLGVAQIVESGEASTMLIILVFALQWASMVLPLLFITNWRHKIKAETFALKALKPTTILKFIVQGYLLYLLITMIVGAIIVYTGIEIPGYAAQESVLPIFGDNPLDLIVAGFVIVIFAPIIEEIIFRGFLLRAVSNYTGVVAGSIISALIFSLLHFPWQSFIPIFILGLIINSMVIRSRSLVPAICFHILNNGIAFTIQILLSMEIIQIENLV